MERSEHKLASELTPVCYRLIEGKRGLMKPLFVPGCLVLTDWLNIDIRNNFTESVLLTGKINFASDARC